MIIRKRVGGRVSENHGNFAEVDIIGLEGIDEGLFLDTMQIDRQDTQNTLEEFQQRFAIGVELEICTTTEITPWCTERQRTKRPKQCRLSRSRRQTPGKPGQS